MANVGLAVLIAVAAVEAVAQPDAGLPKADTDRPTVIVLLTAEIDESAQRERRFAEELELAVDDFTVERVLHGVGRFLALPLQSQLAEVQPLTETRGAAATLWIGEGESGGLTLHVVALSKGRALVRVVSTSAGDDPEAELALAARELLRKAHQSGELSVEGASGESDEGGLADTEESDSGEVGEAPPQWGVLSAFRITGGWIGHVGPSLQLGGALSGEWWPNQSLFLRATLAGLAGPRAQPADGVVQGWRIEPGLDAGYTFTVGRVKIGPLVGVAVPRSALDVALGSGDNQSYEWWTVRAGLGLDLRVSVTRILSFVLDWTAGLCPRREVFKRLSDRTVVLATPHVDWCFNIGVLLYVD